MLLFCQRLSAYLSLELASYSGNITWNTCFCLIYLFIFEIGHPKEFQIFNKKGNEGKINSTIFFWLNVLSSAPC